MSYVVTKSGTVYSHGVTIMDKGSENSPLEYDGLVFVTEDVKHQIVEVLVLGGNCRILVENGILSILHKGIAHAFSCSASPAMGMHPVAYTMDDIRVGTSIVAISR